MIFFKRKEDKLYKLLYDFLDNGGEKFAKHQMREQSDNTLRIKKLERECQIKERYEYFKFRISNGEILNEADLKEWLYVKWSIENYLKETPNIPIPPQDRMIKEGENPRKFKRKIIK